MEEEAELEVISILLKEKLDLESKAAVYERAGEYPTARAFRLAAIILENIIGPRKRALEWRKED